MNRVRRNHIAIFLMVGAMLCLISTQANAYTRQEVVNAITLAAHSYWAQRVTLDGHSDGKTYAAFTGATTIIEAGKPRYYTSDSGWISLPHMFFEQEESSGHPGMLFAYAAGYEATGDKFLMRCAKALGDTLLRAQADNDGGGWWQDMGMWAYDDVPSSPTYQQRVNYGKFVNWVVYAGREAYQTDRQGLTSNDGCSYLGAYALLYLYQTLPASDPDRNRYLAGAKAYADALVGLKDIHETTLGNYYPYGGGGVPQIMPWATMSRINPGYEAHSDYSLYFSLPHNVNVTLNDDALQGPLFYLMEFYKEAVNNPNLDETIYRDNMRLHATYLMDVFDLNALANGRSTWSAFYWVNDGSASANRPAYGRSYEPPSYSAQDGPQDVLIAWYLLESDTTLKTRINDTLVKWCLFWKYEVPRLNDPSQPFAAKIESTGTDPCVYYHDVYTSVYEANNPMTWMWWIWINHEPGPNHLQWVSSTNTHNVYGRFFGMDALESDPVRNYRSYPLVRGARNYRNTAGNSIASYFDEANSLFLFDGASSTFQNQYLLNAHQRFFTRLPYLDPGLVNKALTDLANNGNGFFGTNSITINSVSYTSLRDGGFMTAVPQLAYAAAQSTETLTDSDGDTVSDADEAATGTDPNDSESYDPDYVLTPNLNPPVNNNNTPEEENQSGGCFIFTLMLK